MRLLNTTTYKLEVFDGSTPMYGILSHRWTHEEMTYQDYHMQRSCERSGYHKIIQACDFAKDNFQDWLWIDTVCIDKKSSAELSEAINSMFEWYQEAQECYVYLADVRPPSEHDFDVVESDFFASDWFTRGWTLQELIAPSRVIFCASNWEIVGVKSSHDGSLYREFSFHVSLNSRITRITGIPEDILRNPYLIRRRTARIEDQAYCLLGLFNVNMPLLYGERAKSFVRLQREILLSTLDESLLAWDTQQGPPAHLSCMLAESPAAFMQANRIEGHTSKPTLASRLPEVVY
ncbi:uncharacterized protein RCC_05096 [Ramularia collo-cygni]|uniref:Heterokaryon incompatibility domain-containing protein n=1 Tax=Ramularia collo-cygni TaxID=112498 RepID=A0A2D3V193_9PEZI|nr:uncharacterized protein RCC_05096 [Ramularia collo-cygni]CZT19250.1 uncharacterized protein RCC_05096 [Ramularia collo-cygni]